MKPVLILVTGLPGSGKTTVAQLLSQYLQAPLIVMGDVVREEAERRGLPKTRKVLAQLARELREREGPAVVARRVLEKVEERFREHRYVVIDGVRNWEEVEEFRRYSRTVLITVHAPPRIRYERLVARGREDDPKTWEEFEWRDLEELRRGLGTVIALADYVIVNDVENLDVLRERVREVAEVITREG